METDLGDQQPQHPDRAPAPGSPWRPAPAFDDPAVLSDALRRRVLPGVAAPGRYIGGELGADRDGFSADRASVLLAFPDVYEVGMSHQGLRILYTLLMDRTGAFCDLAFAPWPDMEQAMRAIGLPLYGLESRRPAGRFDLVGFSLGYELTYTNMLTMIDLSGAPLRAADRGPDDPIFMAGGSCVLNPAVVGPFLDLLVLGDGEDVVLEMAAELQASRAAGEGRDGRLARLRALPGVWWPGAPQPVRSRVVKDLNDYPPPRQIVPVIEPVHDRLALEVMRGCVRGCRFCQAGMITRPVRERDADLLVVAAREGLAASGHAEVSLLSLSTGDYTGLGEAVAGIQDALAADHTNLVLPSLRVDSVDEGLYDRISNERPSSFTFAPEAGSARLRDVVNKNITDEEIVTATAQALRAGVKNVKLYFMIGLPTETDEDLEALAELVGRVVRQAPRGGAQVHVSLSPFSPKAHTTFQWAGQISRAEIDRRNHLVAGLLRRHKLKLSLRDPEISFLEAMLGLGDGRLADVLERAWRAGARFEGWTEYMRIGTWERALAECGVEAAEILSPRDPEAPLPWDGVDVGIDKEFLRRDWRRAVQARTLPDCRLEGPCYDCTSCDGDIQHIFAKLEALQGAPARRGPAIPSHGRGTTRLADDPIPRQTPPAAPGTAGSPEPGSDFDPRNGDPARPGQEDGRWVNWRQQAAAKCWYRVEYTKGDDLVFLGHLDFQRQLHLALRRSRLPVAHSKGYHPHPMLKFGPPLAVGVGGERECLDIAFDHQVPGWTERLGRELPPGLSLGRAVTIGAQAPPSIDQAVSRFDYRVRLPGTPEGGPTAEVAAAAVDAFLASPSRLVVRKRPKGDIQIDARALVPEGGLGLARVDGQGPGPELRISLLRSESGAGLPVHEFLACLFGQALPEPGLCVVTRTGYSGLHRDGRWLSPLEEVGETGLRFWLGRHFYS
ncbi:MAG: TIGR03960 family B12-binding radical SAM protein [bacterium]|nr:TIGR03960 family B12-binding radical SAM protein [bacterium]